MKRALIMEGGAMRSVHSAGALTALVELGFTPEHFDFVLGASAGACNMAYFLSGQTEYFWEMWSKSLITRDFINFRNFLTPGKPVVDVDYVVKNIMMEKHPVDVIKALEARPVFYIIATNCHTGKAEYFINDKPESFFEVIKASSSIPILYHKTVRLNGMEYIDGAVSDSIPVKKAIELGAKEIYVFLTRHEGYRKKKTVADNIVSNTLKKYPKLKDTILNRHIIYNESLDLLESKIEGIKIIIIRPKYNLGITRTTTDPQKLKNAFNIGYYDAMRELKKSQTLKKKDEFQSHPSFLAKGKLG